MLYQSRSSVLRTCILSRLCIPRCYFNFLDWGQWRAISVTSQGRVFWCLFFFNFWRSAGEKYVGDSHFSSRCNEFIKLTVNPIFNNLSFPLRWYLHELGLVALSLQKLSRSTRELERLVAHSTITDRCCYYISRHKTVNLMSGTQGASPAILTNGHWCIHFVFEVEASLCAAYTAVKKLKGVLNEVHIFSKCLLCHFAYFIGFHLRVLFLVDICTSQLCSWLLQSHKLVFSRISSNVNHIEECFNVQFQLVSLCHIPAKCSCAQHSAVRV
jgi:hypothetical protein